MGDKPLFLSVILMIIKTRHLIIVIITDTDQGLIYTKRQPQCCDNSAMTLAILFSLKTMKLLQNRVVTYCQATPLFSMRILLLASSQSYLSIDAEAWCKQTLKRYM